MILMVVMTACGQSVSEVAIQSLNPVDESPDPFVPLNYITNMDTQGGSSSISGSTNRFLSIQSFGGTSVRTYSSSTSFQLTSGIGID